ncbi:YdbL family protein [Desulfogranum mediterraneum]|uniref:YdbL family protein n=1 Tax=Desulfogranum mediterraneum TaxID=160661 RepID=UPI00048B4AF1|nr:YdbL family protein [Desulfogranum mediterraneum]
MKKFLSQLLIMLLLCCGSAWALDLQTAKNQGLVGETSTGYLAAVKPAHGEAVRLAEQINNKRRQHYQQIAQRNKTSLKAVEQLAGEKAMNKTPAGQFVRIKGKWRRK